MLTLIGTGLLWFGWFGFNAGSNLEINAYAALAHGQHLPRTSRRGSLVDAHRMDHEGQAQLARPRARASSPASSRSRRPRALPARWARSSSASSLSPVCLFACSALKTWLGYDDSLDVFGIHGIGGIVGAIGTGIVVNPAFGGAGIVDYVGCAARRISTCARSAYTSIASPHKPRASLVTLVWSGVGSLIVWVIARGARTVRTCQKEIEAEGLDYRRTRRSRLPPVTAIVP